MRPDYPDISRNDLARFVPVSARRILDVGCNMGAFAGVLRKERGAEVWGVEPDVEAARLAVKRLDHVIVGYYDDRVDLPDGYFDAIIFNDSIEHFSDPEQALRLSRRKLAAGGVLSICVPNMLHIDNLEHLVIHKDWEYQAMGIRDNTHLRFFTRKSIARLLSTAGYEVLHQEGVNKQWWDPEKPLRRLLFKLFPKFTEEMRYVQFVTVARVIPEGAERAVAVEPRT